MTLSQEHFTSVHPCAREILGPSKAHLSPTGMSHEGKAPDVPLLGYPMCLREVGAPELFTDDRGERGTLDLASQVCL